MAGVVYGTRIGAIDLKRKFKFKMNLHKNTFHNPQLAREETEGVDYEEF